ncbi:MAG: hypothetical protein ACPHUL_07050 [Marinomonas gallaica]
MRIDLTNYSDDVAEIMSRYAEAQQNLHAQIVNELNALIMQAHFSGIDRGAEEALDCLTKKQEVA